MEIFSILMLILGMVMLLYSLVIAFQISLGIRDRESSIGIFVLATAGTALIAIFAFLIVESSKIKPIDVYQGKTTLEITYKDGMPIDSVVVFKDNK
jgi:hypothetical protein